MKASHIIYLLCMIGLAACKPREKVSMHTVHDLRITEKKKYLNLEGKFEFLNPEPAALHVLELYCDVKTNGRPAGTLTKRPDLNVKPSATFYIPFLLQVEKDEIDFDEKFDKAYDVTLDGYIRYETEGDEETISFKKEQRVSISTKKKKEETDSPEGSSKKKKKKNEKNKDEVQV